MAFDFHNELTTIVPHLRAFARSLTQDADSADDLVQDTIVRAMDARQQFTPGTNFKAWMFTILRNLHVNGLRRKYRTQPLDDVSASLHSVPAAQDSSLEYADLRRALAQLSHDQREVLVLVGATGFSYEEAAAICGCAVGTIKSRLSRARRELFRLMVGERAANGGRLPPRQAMRRLRQVGDPLSLLQAGNEETRATARRSGAATEETRQRQGAQRLAG
jgi:RNA polymerase sigma-70 factor (ECF subfamily)